MSQAEELLNSVSANNEIAVQTANPETEGHIIVDSNRFITVPDELKRIAVANDHNIETVTFECPRYWDGHDLSQMQFYINYQSPDKSLGCYVVKSLEIDPATDGNILHFDWTITRNVAKAEGKVVFLVCAKQVDKDGNEVLHWNSELCEDLYVSEGLECDDVLEEEYPDLYTQLLELINNVNTTYPDMYPKVEKLANDTKNVYDSTKQVYSDTKNVYDSTKQVYDDLDKLGIGNGVLYTPNKYCHFYADDTVDIFSSSSAVALFWNHNNDTIDKKYLIKSSLTNAECSIWLMANYCRILYRVPLDYTLFQDMWDSAAPKVEEAKEALSTFIIGLMRFNLTQLETETGVKIKPSFKSAYDAGIVYASYDFIDFKHNAKFLGKVSVPANIQPTYTGLLEISLQDIGNFMYNPNYLYPNSDNTGVNFPTYFTVDMTFPCEEVGSKVAIADLPKNYIEIGATEVSTQNNTMYSGGVE
jgi:hypothetical protein